MRILALDLSKTSTGFCLWSPADARPLIGHWRLGSEYTPRGRVYGKLHEEMSGLNSLGRIDAIAYEEPIDAGKLQGFTNVDTLRLATGLAEHVQSWAAAMAIKPHLVASANHSSWVRVALGPIRRGTKRATLKEMSLAMARQLGFKPQNDDESDGLGVMIWACDHFGVAAPWLKVQPLPLVLQA